MEPAEIDRALAVAMLAVIAAFPLLVVAVAGMGAAWAWRRGRAWAWSYAYAVVIPVVLAFPVFAWLHTNGGLVLCAYLTVPALTGVAACHWVALVKHDR